MRIFYESHLNDHSSPFISIGVLFSVVSQKLKVDRPLIDPIKYMLGKYDNSYNILELPKFYSNDHINSNSEYHKKYKKINQLL